MKISASSFSFLWLLLVLSSTAYGQEEKLDSLKEKIKLNRIVVGSNLVTPLSSIVYPYRKSFEINTEVHLSNSKIIHFDVGNGTIDRQTSVFPNFSISGNFYKIGLSKNWVFGKTKSEILYTGVKLATSRVNQNRSILIQDTYWGDQLLEENSKNIYIWSEFFAGAKVFFFSNIYFGTEAVVKARLLHQKSTIFNTPYVPGYGINALKTRFNLTYYVGYSIHIK